MILARVYIVRHGETEENKIGVIQGQLDTSLNETGLQQSELVARALKGVPFEFAFSSDLTRAVDTARAILRYHPGVELIKAAELREKFMGVQQGLTAAERAQLPSASVSESLESSEAFAGRLTAWWERHVNEGILALAPRSTAYDFLVVSHGGAIGTLVRNLLCSGEVKCGDGVSVWKLLNTGVSVIEFSGSKGGSRKLVKYGDISHLLGKTGVVENNADVKE